MEDDCEKRACTCWNLCFTSIATFLLKALKDRHRGLFSPSAQIQNKDELQSAETAASGRFHLRLFALIYNDSQNGKFLCRYFSVLPLLFKKKKLQCLCQRQE